MLYMEEVNKTNANKVSFMADDDYKHIQRYANTFRDILVAAGHGVDPATDYEDETLALILDKSSLDKLFALSPMIAAVIGVHDQKLSVSLLAVDPTTRQVLDAHRSGTPGQQVWPYAVPVMELNTFLR